MENELLYNNGKEYICGFMKNHIKCNRVAIRKLKGTNRYICELHIRYIELKRKITDHKIGLEMLDKFAKSSLVYEEFRAKEYDDFYGNKELFKAVEQELGYKDYRPEKRFLPLVGEAKDVVKKGKEKTSQLIMSAIYSNGILNEILDAQ